MRVIATAVLAPLVAASFGVTPVAGDARRAFAESWRGKHVVVRRTLVTLVYDEHGRFGRTYPHKREGLTVVTPLAGEYFQFDGRDSEQDITSREPREVMDLIAATYIRDHPLDTGFFQRIQPLEIVRYERGTAIVVKTVAFDRDRVRLSFVKEPNDPESGPIVTSLTVKWPTDLSAGLTERSVIEILIRGYVDDGATGTGDEGAYAQPDVFPQFTHL